MAKQIIIFDTTLRDGEQSPGATMTKDEKINVATILDSMGVDVIEAGFAAASPGDAACIEAVAEIVESAVVCSLARGVKSDISAAAKALEKANKPRIHTFISTSAIHIEHQFNMTYERVLEIIDETVRYAKSFCDDVEWSAMDATRSDRYFLIQAVKTAIDAGARTINIPDTVGYAMPNEYRNLMTNLSELFPEVIFSVHCHNDLGLATANSLSGVLGGAQQIECTINGIGERAGNAALEEVVMAIKTRPDIYPFHHNVNTQQISSISRYVSDVTGFEIQKNKAIVGENAFAHESGIHQDGMLKNRSTYEIMTPQSVGMPQTEIILGKHSGRAALKSKISEWGFKLDDTALQELFIQFKELCDKQKVINKNDIMSLIKEEVVS